MAALAGGNAKIGLLTAVASRANGGVFEAVVEHALLLRRLGYRPEIFAVADAGAAADRARFDDMPVHLAQRTGPAQIGYAPALGRMLRSADLAGLHLHGIWTAVSGDGADWARATGRPYIISPHGMLERWIVARSRAKKAVARRLFERRGWGRAALMAALTEQERADIRREGIAAPVAVIPNAVALPDQPPAGPRGDTMLFLSRIHPKKNVESLVTGWRASGAAQAGWTLRIAGWGEPDDVRRIEAAIAGDPSIAYVGAVFDEAKAALLETCGMLVLPSFSEGLPMAVLEAWAAGMPVLMSQGCNLPQGFAAGAAIDCGTDPAAIAAALDRAVALAPAGRRAMEAAARTLAAGSFSRPVIEARWGAVYQGLLG